MAKFKFFKERDITDEELDEFFSNTIDDKFDEEVKAVLDEIRWSYHADDPQYKAAVDSLKVLIEAKSAYDKATTEKEKVDAQAKSDEARRKLDINVILPVLIKAGVSMLVIAFWISLEQQRPLPQKTVNWATNLVLPR